MKHFYFLVCLWFGTLVTLTASRTLCPRIFFQNIDENKIPYKVIEGVFVKQSYTHNGFPVYLRENDNLLFYYNKHSSGDSLLFGLNFNHYFGIAARILSYVTPSSWLASAASLNRNDVFSGLIYRWIYWSDRDNTSHIVDTPPPIKAVCVEDDFRECNSDRVYMNVNFNDDSGNTLNDATTDYFSRISGRFRNLRPVYKHNTQLWYLQYTSDQYWLVTSTYTPTSSLDSGVYMKVNDLALRPEYITKTWSVRYNGWRDNYSLKVRCRGVSSMVNKCPTSPCKSGSTCVYTSGNETLCICASGYTGIRCDINKQCSTLHTYYGREFGFRYRGKRPGDLAMTFCRGRYPSERFAICEDQTYGSYWTRQDRPCTAWVSTTSSTPFTSTTSTFTKNSSVNIPKVEPKSGIALGVTAILLQVFLPFIIWCCALCRVKCNELGNELDDATRRQELDEELEVTATADRQAVQQCQRETEENEVKRKEGLCRNITCFRFISMTLYFSFYLWLIYFVIYKALGQQLQGSIFFALYVIAVIMLVVAPIVVLIESAFSQELDYIKNIMEDETDVQLKPWWIRPMYFWLATLLFMTWPYRWLFRAKIAKIAKNYYDLKKKISKSTTPPREVDQTDRLAAHQQSDSSPLAP